MRLSKCKFKKWKEEKLKKYVLNISRKADTNNDVPLLLVNCFNFFLY